MSAKEKYTEKYCGITSKDFERLEDRYKKTLEIFSKHKFERILDAGCGDGNFSVLLKEACKANEVYGIEISEKGVEMAKNNGVIAYKLDMDEEYFPFEDNYFSAVFAGEVIEHLFDPDHFLDEVHRVLKPKGIFVLSTPNLASIHNRIALLFGYQPFPIGVSTKYNIGLLITNLSVEVKNSRVPQASAHVKVFTLRSLKELLKIHEFEILEIKGSSCPMLPENMKFKRIAKAVDKVFSMFPRLSYRVILICSSKA